MTKTIKKQITKKIDVAKENNELTALKMYNIAYESVIQTENKLGEEVSSIHAITKDVVTISIQALVKANVSSLDTIFATLLGVTDGVKHVKSRNVDNLKNELIEQETILANSFRIALKGVEEASKNFTGSIKDDIESALADTKLKNTELLGLTVDTIKHAIFNAIESSTQVENDIILITRDATVKALAESYFDAERISKITEKVLLAAVETAEEVDIHILLTASATTEGIFQGLKKSVETTHKSMSKIKGNLPLTVDLEQIQGNLESLESLFSETLRKVADKSESSAKELLHELAHDIQKAGSTLREKTVLATQTVSNRIDERDKKLADKLGKNRNKSTYLTIAESKKLGKRMFVVARGATNINKH